MDNAIGFFSSGVVFVIIVFLVTGALFVRSDRRRQLRAGRYPGPPCSGRCAQSVPVDLHSSPEDASAVASVALQLCSRKEVVAVHPWTWVGWTGISWRSWGQELSVVVCMIGPEWYRLFCSSWPRFAATLIDWGASRKAADALAVEVQRRANL
jgi:hypothetical protein